jgi:NADPH:quinone reductase-like Zn-dependent oxidoreductase
LIKVAGSSLNPDEISILDTPLVSYTPGIDVSGTVAELGLGVQGFEVGDRVWSMFATGGMAEYTTRLAALTAKVPEGLELAQVGTLPTVAMTTLGALQSAGAPWDASRNATVLITNGTGGTGYAAVQLAKALGASRVVTAVGPGNIGFAKSLGADVVVDYHKQSVFDAVDDGSVDVVLNNHNSAGNAVRAMQKLRAPGGVFVTIAGGKADNPPAGIKQIDYDLWAPKEMADFRNKLDMITGFLSDGKMRIVIQDTYDFDHVVDAFTVMAAGHVQSKLSIVPKSATSRDVALDVVV